MRLIDDKANLVGCIIRDITVDEHGTHIIVQRDDEVFPDLFEIYPVIMLDGPNARVEMHSEDLST